MNKIVNIHICHHHVMFVFIPTDLIESNFSFYFVKCLKCYEADGHSGQFTVI